MPRDAEAWLAERGIDVSFQTVCEWTAKFGYQFADQLRRRSRGNFADKWHLDEMVVSIKGKKYWLWRAVDADGYVLDALLQTPIAGSAISSIPASPNARQRQRT